MPVLQALVSGLTSAVSWEVFPYIIVGSLLGLVIGIIPGIGGHFAMAMAIPFIFRMSPATGIAFILGAHASVAQGGGLTAILFGIPGTGQNAATVLDGPPMTAKGEAGRAVGAAMTACFMGAAFGVFVLALLLPVLRQVVLAFGPPEFFMLALLALTFIAVLSGKGISVNRGLIAGTLGLLFSFVGMCNVTGIRRFTFGSMELWSGLPMVAVMLGLFAVAEMLHLWIEGGSLARKATEMKARAMQQQIFQGVFDTLRNWWLVIRCSAIGTTIGLIPGLGSSSAAFLAYAHAKQTSKNPEEFGKGAVEGVIGPESANDAVEGGALACTVAFGLPGSSSMAILLTALLILGVQPGRELMVQRLDLVFVMIWTVVLGNLFGTLAGIVLVNPLARVTFLRSSVLVPVLLAVVLTGAFVVRGVMFDIVIAFIFGLLGYAMKKLDYSRPAFIIGLILGIMVEKNFYLSSKLYGGTFFLQPVALVLLVITLVILVYNIYVMVKGERRHYSRAG
jgi:TctA family transporter